MPTIPHDASRTALLQPGSATDFFSLGDLTSEAALCAEMARVAYVKDEARLREYLTRARGVGLAGFELRATIGYQGGGTQGFVATAPGVAVVAFRGTETDDPTDLFTDANFPFTDWLPDGQLRGQVHVGFAEALTDALYTHLIAAIPKDVEQVWFTGHSLGAALATLAASRFGKAARLFTFGSPRVGDTAFAASMAHVTHTRFVDCCDMVTRVPPEVIGYIHSGTLHYINQHGQVLVSPAEELIDANRMAASGQYLLEHAFRFGTVPVRELADHAPLNYVSAVAGWRT